MTGALWAKRGERDISCGARHEREARDEGKRQQQQQPLPQGFSLKKWVGREKAQASAGHVSLLNINMIGNVWIPVVDSASSLVDGFSEKYISLLTCD